MQLLANHSFCLPLPQGTFRKLLTWNPMDEGEAAPASMADPSVVCYIQACLICWAIPEVTKQEVTLVAIL